MTTPAEESVVYLMDESNETLKEARLVFVREFDNHEIGRDPVYLQMHPLPKGKVRVTVTVETLHEGEPA